MITNQALSSTKMPSLSSCENNSPPATRNCLKYFIRRNSPRKIISNSKSVQLFITESSLESKYDNLQRTFN